MPWHNYGGNHWHPVRGTDIRHNGFQNPYILPQGQRQSGKVLCRPKASDKSEIKPLLSTSKGRPPSALATTWTLFSDTCRHGPSKENHSVHDCWVSYRKSLQLSAKSSFHPYIQSTFTLNIYQEPGIGACEKDRKNKSVISRQRSEWVRWGWCDWRY